MENVKDRETKIRKNQLLPWQLRSWKFNFRPQFSLIDVSSVADAEIQTKSEPKKS